MNPIFTLKRLFIHSAFFCLSVSQVLRQQLESLAPIASNLTYEDLLSISKQYFDLLKPVYDDFFFLS